MNLEQLDEAVRLKTELAKWRDAMLRCRPEGWKSAELIVTDAAHGHMGQQSQTKIALDRDVLVPLVEERIAAITTRLKAFGVEA